MNIIFALKNHIAKASFEKIGDTKPSINIAVHIKTSKVNGISSIENLKRGNLKAGGLMPRIDLKKGRDSKRTGKAINATEYPIFSRERTSIYNPINDVPAKK